PVVRFSTVTVRTGRGLGAAVLTSWPHAAIIGASAIAISEAGNMRGIAFAFSKGADIASSVRDPLLQPPPPATSHHELPGDRFANMRTIAGQADSARLATPMIATCSH